MMKKMKFSVLLLATALILLFSSCSGMMTETDDVNIDLSGVVSKATIDGAAVDTVKIWLVAEGTSNFYDLGSQSTQDISSSATITLTHIPVGPTYRIYMSIGNDDGTKFTAVKTVTGLINVTGGTATDKTLISEDIKTNLALIGTSLSGAAFADGEINTVSTDGAKLYHGTISSLGSINAPAGVLFRDVDRGYGNDIVVSAKATDGRAIGVYTGGASVDFSASDELPAAWFGDPLPADKTIDILSSFVYYDSVDAMQLGISKLNEGIILSVRGEFVNDNGTPDVPGDDYTEDRVEWMPVPLGEALEALEEFDVTIDATFFKGFSVMKNADTVWLFVASKIGNYRIEVPVNDDGLGEFSDNPLEILADFVTGNEDLGDRVVLNLDNNGNDFLYVGTDSGLYKMTATANVADMAAAKVYAEGKRIELLKCGTTYTACVTALNLILINNETGAVARIAFNEGLPVDPDEGLLNGEGGITGLAWNGNTLYIAGGYGLASINAADASLWD